MTPPLAQQLRFRARLRLEEYNAAAPREVQAAFLQTKMTLEKSVQPLYAYLCACLPLSDYLLSSAPAAVADYLCHGLFLYRSVPAVRALDIYVFLEYVLQPRVNNERLEPCRGTLYKALAPCVSGLSGADAALAVNKWCARQAGYEASDGRTAAALTVLRAAKGRCGEESVLAVHALRSVGLPARQVYAPRWAHCDDNHAWVEVYCGGRWHYMGACEPQEALNRGWFTQSAARAMLIHSRVFSLLWPQEHAYRREKEKICDSFGLSLRLNRLERYAPVKRLSVTVEEDGQPKPGVTVDFELLNYAGFEPIASVQTNCDGMASLLCGYGTLHLRAFKDGRSAEALAAPQDTACTLLLSAEGSAPAVGWAEFDTAAPPVPAGVSQTVPAGGLESDKVLFAAAKAARQERIDGFWREDAVLPVLARVKDPDGLRVLLQKSRGNLPQLLEFLKASVKGAPFWSGELLNLKVRLLNTLSEKDLYDTSAELLLRHLAGALPFAGRFEARMFDEGILCPRVGLEELTDWRTELPELLVKTLPAYGLSAGPAVLWRCLKDKIRHMPQFEYPTLITPPAVCLRARAGSETSLRVLYVAVLRSMGVPAKLRPDDGAPLYWRYGAWQTPYPDAKRNALLTLRGAGEAWRVKSNWSIARLQEGRYVTLNLEDEKWDKDELRLPLPAGRYRLLTASRLPCGDQLAAERVLDLSEGGNETVAMHLRVPAMAQMLQSIRLPEFSVTEKGAAASARGAGIYFWLDAASEPTRHLLDELYEMRAAYVPLAEKMWFILPGDGAQDNQPLAKLRGALLGAHTAQDTGGWAEKIARSMFLDPGALPLVLLTAADGRGAYAGCGYNVGTAQLLFRLWQLL